MPPQPIKNQGCRINPLRATPVSTVVVVSVRQHATTAFPMGHDGRELSSREKEENGIAQQEELEALEAIYGDDFEVVNPGSAASCTEVRLCV